MKTAQSYIFFILLFILNGCGNFTSTESNVFNKESEQEKDISKSEKTTEKFSESLEQKSIEIPKHLGSGFRKSSISDKIKVTDSRPKNLFPTSRMMDESETQALIERLHKNLKKNDLYKFSLLLKKIPRALTSEETKSLLNQLSERRPTSDTESRQTLVKLFLDENIFFDPARDSLRSKEFWQKQSAAGIDPKILKRAQKGAFQLEKLRLISQLELALSKQNKQKISQILSKGIKLHDSLLFNSLCHLLNTTNGRKIFKWLVEKKGLNVNHQFAAGNTFLHTVQNPQGIDLLLRLGADTSIQNTSGRTPLSAFLKNRGMTTGEDGASTLFSFESLLKASSLETINSQDKLGRTPLLNVSTYDGLNTTDVALALMLMEKKPDLFLPDQLGFTPAEHWTYWGTRYQDERILSHLRNSSIETEATLNNYNQKMKEFTPFFRVHLFRMLEAYLNSPLNRNLRLDNGKTPLMVAIESRNSNLVFEVLQGGADANFSGFILDSTEEFTAETPLQTWAGLLPFNKDHETDLTKTFDLLITAGAEINTQNYYGYTALDMALYYQSKLAIKLLKSKGAKTRKQLREEQKKVTNPIPTNLLSGFRKSSISDKIKVTESNNSHLLTQNAQAEIQQKALNDLKEANRLLFKSANETNNIEDAKKAIYNCAQVNKKDKFGSTALLYAATNGFLEMTRFLLDHQAYVNTRNNSGYTPLRMALSHGSEEVFFELLNRGASIFEVDNFGNTLLHTAAASNKPYAVEPLLKRGLNPKTVNYSGSTALDYALRWSPKAATILKQYSP